MQALKGNCYWLTHLAPEVKVLHSLSMQIKLMASVTSVVLFLIQPVLRFNCR